MLVGTSGGTHMMREVGLGTGGGGTGRILIVCGILSFMLGILDFILAKFAVAPKNSIIVLFLRLFFAVKQQLALGIHYSRKEFGFTRYRVKWWSHWHL